MKFSYPHRVRKTNTEKKPKRKGKKESSCTKLSGSWREVAILAQSTLRHDVPRWQWGGEEAEKSAGGVQKWPKSTYLAKVSRREKVKFGET